MRTIKLKTLSMLHFKGISRREINFNTDGITTISGRNATGKSTVRDAFLWLMFDKNAAGEKDFGIKTNDTDGNPIPNLPHEVIGTLLVDGLEVRLRKCLVEKWVKKSGATEKVFSGNTTEYYINDVPKKAGEYNAYIAGLCDETVFRTITNPAYLPSMKRDLLRPLLFSMAGEPTNADIVGDDPDLRELLDTATGKTMAELLEQAKAEKARIRKELDQLPARIDELQRTRPEAEDWNELERLKQEQADALRLIDQQLEDAAKAVEVANQSRMAVRQQIAAKKTERFRTEQAFREAAFAEYNRDTAKQQELKSRHAALGYAIANLRNSIVSIESDIRLMDDSQQVNQSKLDKLRKEWHAIQAETFEPDDNQFICPTCGRRLEDGDIASRMEEMKARFNAGKAERLTANQKQGMALKARMQQAQDTAAASLAEAERAREEIARLEEQQKAIQSDPLYGRILEQPDATLAIAADPGLKAIDQEIAAMEAQLAQPVSLPGTEELKQQRSGHEQQLAALNERLYKRQHIGHINARIEELTARQRELSQLLADRERVEDRIARFNRRKTELTEDKINALFALVRWKMYRPLINGGEEPVCIPMVDGVDYRDANSAARMNAGLDIINAFCRHHGVYAPIFVDNAEGVNQLLPTASQMIRLVVTTEPRLNISYE